MSYPYYRFFPGDYLRDTQGLTLAQHGAYRLLLDMYYAQGKPLEGSAADICRKLPIKTRHDRAAVLYVLTRFFTFTEGVWKQQRVNRELERMSHVTAKAVDSAKKRWSEGNANAHANAMRTQSHIDLDLEPDLDQNHVVQNPNIVARATTAQQVFKKGNGKTSPQWWMSEAGTVAKGRELGIEARPGEEFPEYRQRLFDRIRATSRGEP